MYVRKLLEQVTNVFCCQKFWHFTVWINCSCDLKILANCRPSASNFEIFSRSLLQFFLTVGQTILVTKYHLKVKHKDILWNFTFQSINEFIILFFRRAAENSRLQQATRATQNFLSWCALCFIITFRQLQEKLNWPFYNRVSHSKKW